MKFGRVVAVVSSLMLASVVQAGSLVPNRTLNITFSDYCDGVRLVINQTTGIVKGEQTGCLSEPIVGTVGALSKIGAGVTILSSNLIYVIDDSPRDWTIYDTNGHIVNSGTYTLGTPELRAIGGPTASMDP